MFLYTRIFYERIIVEIESVISLRAEFPFIFPKKRGKEQPQFISTNSNNNGILAKQIKKLGSLSAAGQMVLYKFNK